MAGEIRDANKIMHVRRPGKSRLAWSLNLNLNEDNNLI